MAGRDFWQWPPFLEAYRARRQEGKPRAGPGNLLRVAPLLSPISPLSAKSWHSGTARSNVPTTRSGNGEHGYSLIRSDIEDEHAHPLPKMPLNALGVRQRTLQQLAFQRTVFDSDQQQQGPMAWVDSAWFQGLSGVVIFANAVVVGLETDIDTPLWFYVEQLLLTFFVCELVFRLGRFGCHFFRHEEDWAWNLFDLSIVMSGVFDSWLVPLITLMGLVDLESGGGGGMSMVFMLMRMARLLRIVRLFRLVRIVRPLYQLAQGVLEALQGMFWVLVFMAMTLYSAAVLCTRLLGRDGLLPEHMAADEEVQHIQGMFSSVDESMFTLFGTMSSWSLLRFVPLFEEMPWLRPLFVLFYVYSAWALLAVMTGVVSENMIAIREQMVKEDEVREEMRKTQVTQMLMDLFREVDADNSGTVSREEFNAMLRSTELTRKITRNTHLKVQDLQDLFEWLDHDGVGTITVDEFMTGFRWANEPLRARSLVKLQERIANDLKRLEASINLTVKHRVGEVQQLVATPLRKVHAVTEQLQGMDVTVEGIRSHLREAAMAAPTAQEIREVEERLCGKLAAAVARLEAVGRGRSYTSEGRPTP